MSNSIDIFRGKKALITGGLGFLGSTLAHRLVGLGSHVTVMDSLIPDYGGNLFNVEDIKDQITINISDVRDQASMNHLVKGQDFLFNLAGTLSHIDSMREPFTDLDINCRSQLCILEACRRNNPELKIVFAGTRGQYGKPQFLPVTEDHPMRPTDVNGINNLAGEWYHILYHNVYGIRATSLRLTNIYGPRHQMRHSRQGVLNWFIRQLMDGEEIHLYGNGCQKRDTNFVADVVEAFLLAMGNECTNGEAYNIGGTPFSLREFVERAISVYGGGCYRVIPFPETQKAIEVGDYIADYSKFQRLTGWFPRWDLNDGLRETFSFYEKKKSHYW